MNLKKGDTVMIITGKDRGRKGKILEVFPAANRVIVEGLNLRTKNVRPKRSGEKGQLVRFSAAMDASNVMVVCGKCGKTTRVKYDRTNDRKVRICRHCKNEL